MTDIERFMRHIDEHDEDGCWAWRGPKSDRFEAIFRARGANGKLASVRAQRWAFEHFLRPLQRGQVIRTLCGDHDCLSPEHLIAVTWKVARGLDEGRCGRGHPLTEANTLETPAGSFCRACHGLDQVPALVKLLEVA